MIAKGRARPRWAMTKPIEGAAEADPQEEGVKGHGKHHDRQDHRRQEQRPQRLPGRRNRPRTRPKEASRPMQHRQDRHDDGDLRGSSGGFEPARIGEKFLVPVQRPGRWRKDQPLRRAEGQGRDEDDRQEQEEGDQDGDSRSGPISIQPRRSKLSSISALPARCGRCRTAAAAAA